MLGCIGEQCNEVERPAPQTAGGISPLKREGMGELEVA